MAFNALRYLLAALCVVPLLLKQSNRTSVRSAKPDALLVRGSLLAGIAMFLGAGFQQAGIVYTTAGKAGFITGLYTVFVPLIALIRGEVIKRQTWFAVALAVSGLYLLSATNSTRINKGDILVLVSALAWAGHVITIGHFSPKLNPYALAVGQCLVCSGLSFVGALFFEKGDFSGAPQAWAPIVYAGCFSIGVGFTLQILGQRHAKTSHAAIIMSLESVFAAIGGWLILNEVMSGRTISGCALMLCGMVLAQFSARDA